MGEGYALPLYMRLEKGCGIEFYSGKYRFLLRIEDDRITSLRAGLSIRTTDKEKPQRGVKIAQNTCNFSNVK
jgi:hypothetical protein